MVVALAVLGACSADIGSRVPTTKPDERVSTVYRRPLQDKGGAATTAVPRTAAPSSTSTTVASPTTTALPPATTTTTAPVVTSWQLPSTPASIGGCQIFDRRSVFHSLAIGLPVHSQSAAWIDAIGADEEFRYSISTNVWQGSRPGVPFNVVDSRVIGFDPVSYDPNYASSEAWVSPMPIPDNPLIQGDPTPAWDRHLLIVDQADCTYYELWYYDPIVYQLTGAHWALTGARWTMGDGGALVPQRGTTVSAAPMVGTTVRLAEVQAGRIDHVIGACSQANGPTRIWPARKSDGTNTSPTAPPVGARLRLKSTVNLNAFTGQARVIAEAMATHGVMITDTCYRPLQIVGENVAYGWDDTNLKQLKNLRIGDFEAVDTTPMMLSEESWQVR
jgi:hypothetical protein